MWPPRASEAGAPARQAASRYAALIAAQRPARDAAMAFEAHALACVLAQAGAECTGESGEPGLVEALGLPGRDLETLWMAMFPAQWRGGPAFDRDSVPSPCDERAMLEQLLLDHRAGHSAAEAWWAAILARRSLEPGHLWQALGLPNRADLRRVIEHHFPTLAAKNTQNMRWKRFFYREICAAEGYAACPVPDCRDCSSHAECFGLETPAAVIAHAA